MSGRYFECQTKGSELDLGGFGAPKILENGALSWDSVDFQVLQGCRGLPLKAWFIPPRQYAALPLLKDKSLST